MAAIRLGKRYSYIGDKRSSPAFWRRPRHKHRTPSEEGTKLIAAVPHDYTPACWKSSARSSPLLSYFLLIVEPAGASYSPVPGSLLSSSPSSRLPSSELLYPAVSIFIFLIASQPSSLRHHRLTLSLSLSLSLSHPFRWPRWRRWRRRITRHAAGWKGSAADF